MEKLYGKDEVLFAVLWIAVYCAVSIPIRGAFGDESPAMLAGLLVIAAAILAFVKKQKLEEKYGLVKWKGKAGDYLFFIPMLVLMTGNLWGGTEIAYDGVGQLFAALGWVYRGTFISWIFVSRPFEKGSGFRGDYHLGGNFRYRTYREPSCRTGNGGDGASGIFCHCLGISLYLCVL